MFIEEIWTWRFVENAGSAAFVVRQIVSATWVEVLYVDRIASRTNINIRFLGNRGQSRPRSYLVVGIVAKFRRCIIHLPSNLLKSVCSRAWVLSFLMCTFSKCFWVKSGSFALREGPFGSKVDLFESQFPGPGIKPSILESFKGPPSAISCIIFHHTSLPLPKEKPLDSSFLNQVPSSYVPMGGMDLSILMPISFPPNPKEVARLVRVLGISYMLSHLNNLHHTKPSGEF